MRDARGVNRQDSLMSRTGEPMTGEDRLKRHGLVGPGDVAEL